jgi:hypothetical protein
VDQALVGGGATQNRITGQGSVPLDRVTKHATPAGAPWLYADAPLTAMREAPMAAFGIVERFSTLRIRCARSP